MKFRNTIPQSANTTQGIRGIVYKKGGNADLAWNTAFEFVITEFELTPEQTKEILDNNFGEELGSWLYEDGKRLETEAEIIACFLSELSTPGNQVYFETRICDALNIPYELKDEYFHLSVADVIAQHFFMAKKSSSRKPNEALTSQRNIGLAIEVALEIGLFTTNIRLQTNSTQSLPSV